ncbi:hypothetical protein [Streptomyces sp. 8N616]|uniref:hypothetical protein n=1 Tax=Streptomyces sp. 8N616 TaxID=3457414 RepID=UPI003FD14F71
MHIVLSPFYAAKLVFQPSRPDRIEDPTVKKLQVWRTVLGVAAWVSLTVAYSTINNADDIKVAAHERFNQAWFSTLALSCTFPVVVGAFVFATRGSLRRVYLRRALRPLGALLAVNGAGGLVIGASLGIQHFVGLPGKLISAVVLLWAMGFVLYGMVLALVHVFRTADIHELVPPTLAPILVWEMAILDLITGSYADVPLLNQLGYITGSYADVPLLIRVGFILGAPVSVTALSWWEAHRLRRHHGLTLRGALLR